MLARKELEGTEREQLSAVIAPVVLFMVLGSCVVHVRPPRLLPATTD